MIDPKSGSGPSAPALRFGVLGTARIAAHFVRGVAASRRVHVEAIGSRSAETAEHFAREHGIGKAYGSYEAVLADREIDAIYIPLPNHLHAHWAEKALRSGKHVLCEKPMTMSAAETRRLFAVASDLGLYVREAFPYLSQPYLADLRRLAAGGELGRLRLIQAHFSFMLEKPDDFRRNADSGGGALFDIGIYPVSLVRILTGVAPCRVEASAAYEGGVDFNLVANLTMPDGCLAQIGCSFGAARSRHARLLFERGSIDTNFPNHVSDESPCILDVWTPNSRDPRGDHVAPCNGFLAEAEAFADLVSDGRWFGASAGESCDIAAMIDAIRADASGRG